MIDPRQKEYDDFYTEAPTKWADDKRNKFAFDAISKHLKEPPKNFIDIGCGNGHTVQYLAERWPDAKPWGMDLSPVAIGLAKGRVPNGTFLCTPFEDCKQIMKFDIVLALGVLEHFEDHSVTLPKLRDMVGGLFYVELPNCIGYPRSTKVEGFRRLNQGNHQMEWHLWRPSWERLFKKYGFTIVEAIKGPTIYTEFVWILKP